MFTQHPTRIAALPKDLRPDPEKLGKETLYLRDVPDEVADEVWERFLSAIEPLRTTGKLGTILLQFPPWFTISRSNKDYILSCVERLTPRYRTCVEFRHQSWLSEKNREETLNFLSGNRVPLVCVDMPQGYASSVPPLLAATADLAVVRFHGHSEKWTSKNIEEKFGYRYSDEELCEWAPRLLALAAEAERTQVLMNNCYRNYAQVNAERLTELLA